MSVYLDLVVLINFLVDFLLLLGTNRLSGFPAGAKRAAMAAGLGAVYSGMCILPGFRFMGSIFWRLVCLGLMGGIAFGWNGTALKRCGIFVLLSMSMGGMAVGFGRGGFWMLAMAAGSVWLLCRVGFGSTVGGREYVPVEISARGRTIRLTALRDSGNTLRDPLTGEQVLVIEADAAEKLTGLTEHQLRSPMETMLKKPLSGLRLIPYRSVGQPAGMLLGMRFSDVKIGDRKSNAVVAFAAEAIGKGEGYQALTGGVI